MSEDHSRPITFGTKDLSNLPPLFHFFQRQVGAVASIHQQSLLISILPAPILPAYPIANRDVKLKGTKKLANQKENVKMH